LSCTPEQPAAGLPWRDRATAHGCMAVVAVGLLWGGFNDLPYRVLDPVPAHNPKLLS
jgi:hypothetical protein